MSGDIAEMYHRVKIKQQDQNSQRFLWRTGYTERELKDYAMVAMTFVANYSTLAAQYDKNSNAKQLLHML